MVFWWLLGIPGEQAATLYFKYSTKDSRQIKHKKILKNECIRVLRLQAQDSATILWAVQEILVLQYSD